MDDVPSLGVALVMMGDKERGEQKKKIFIDRWETRFEAGFGSWVLLACSVVVSVTVAVCSSPARKECRAGVAVRRRASRVPPCYTPYQCFEKQLPSPSPGACPLFRDHGPCSLFARLHLQRRGRHPCRIRGCSSVAH